jgi:hypothetical protein
MKFAVPITLAAAIVALTGCSSVSVPRAPTVASISHSNLLSQITYDAQGFYRPVPVPGRLGMYMLRDGSIVSGPPNDPAVQQAAKLHRVSPQIATCTDPAWSGNIPPKCATTGAFRRAFSTDHALAGVSSELYLPSQVGMPSPPGDDGSTGFAYIELWPTSNLSNSAEGGMLYNAGSDTYTMYYSNSVDGFHTGTQTFPSGNYVTILESVDFTNSGGTYTFLGLDTVAQEGSGDFIRDEHLTLTPPAGFNNPPNPVWGARMTTIAQNYNSFMDGSDFKGIQWIGAVGWYFHTDGTIAYWSNFNGTQRWPSVVDKIIVDPLVDQDDETVEIYLHS